jgi:hypothetical protein
MGVAIITDGPVVRLFWRALDRLDYWLTQARLWLADAVCGPKPQRGLIGDGSGRAFPPTGADNPQCA